MSLFQSKKAGILKLLQNINIFQEIKLILRSKWRVFLLLILPLFITTYYCLLFGAGTVQEIKTVIVDLDNSSLSRTLKNDFRRDQTFKVIAEENNIASAEKLIHQEKAEVILQIPPNLSQDLKAGKKVKAALVVDASNMAVSSTAMKKASQIILTYNEQNRIEKILDKGFLPKQAEKIAAPLQFHFRQIANASGNYLDFLIAGLIGTIVQFPLISLTATALQGRTRKDDFTIILDKLGAYTILGLLEYLLCFWVAQQFFPITYTASFWAVFLLTSVFVLTVVAFGLFISNLMPTPVLATQLSIVVALPALLLSGYTWPLDKMPLFVQVLGLAEPLTHYVLPLRELFLNNWTGVTYWFSIKVLTCYFVGLLSINLMVFQWKKVKKCPPSKSLTA